MEAPHRLSLLVLAALLVAYPAAAAAQDEPYSFTEVVDVALVNVEVWVTDAKGRPVLGLTAEDFEVREDGKVVPISHFSEIGATGVAAAVTAPPAGAAPEPELPAAEPPGHWIVYVDQLHLSAIRQKRLIKDARDFLLLSGIAPERVLLLRQGRGLGVEANFGSTREELDSALSRIASSKPAAGQLAAQAKRVAIDRLRQMWEVLLLQSVPDPCDFFPQQAVPEVNRYARQAAERTNLTLGNLASTASFLAGVPGVKTLIYAGDALETHPGRDLLLLVRELCPGHTDDGRFLLPRGLETEFRKLTRNANANRVTMYTIETGGLRSSVLQGAEQRSLGELTRAANLLEPAIRGSNRSGLEYLAVETGGRPILNRNRFESALGEIAQEMSSYYSLAYEPPHGGDGLEHRIKVRVPDSGFAVRHRLNYRDKSRGERLTDRLQSALYLGVSSNPLALRLGAGGLTPAGDDRFTLRLHLLVPADRVVFLPQGDSAVARLEATVAIRVPGRPKIELVERVLPVPAPPAGSQMTLDLVVPVELEAGPKVLAVALRDQASNETSFVSTSVEIQAPDG